LTKRLLALAAAALLAALVYAPAASAATVRGFYAALVSELGQMEY